MVGVIVAAKGVPGVQCAVQREVEVILGDELPQVGRTEVIFLCTEGIFQIKGIDAQLVGHDHIHIVRHAAGDPVVTADGLQPPDLVYVLKSDAVHLVSTVLLQQAAQTQHALAGRMDVGQHQIDDIFLADAAGHLGLFALGGLILHQRVCAQYAGIGGDGLGGGHAHVSGVDTGGCPDALALHGVGHGGKPQRALRQGDFHMGKDAAVGLGQLLRVDHGKFFRGEMAGAGVIVAGDHGRAIVRCCLADQNGSASHRFSLHIL